MDIEERLKLAEEKIASFEAITYYLRNCLLNTARYIDEIKQETLKKVEDSNYKGEILHRNFDEMFFAIKKATQSFDNLKDIVLKVEDSYPESKKVDDHIYNKKIEECPFRVRTINCFLSENILTIADLVSKTKGELLRIPNFGRVSLNEVEKYLNGFNLILK